MSIPSFLGRFWRSTRQHGLRPTGAPHRPCRRFMPSLEALEDRCVPTILTVVNQLDSGVGSLRQAILDANALAGPDTIRFAHNVRHITLTSGELAIMDSLDIVGPGASQLRISGNDSSRVFRVQSGTVRITDLTIAEGRADGTAAIQASSGGGILNLGTLTLSNVTLSDNRAIGAAGVIVPVHPLFVVAGGAFGGGVSNFGNLTVSSCTFTGNQALGADDVDVSASSFPGPAFPGNAVGGALSNYATASISRSAFVANLARAGSRGKGDFAAIGGGGAIVNDASLTLTGSTFRHNQAIGGNDSISPLHNGHALGGAIMSGSFLPLIGLPGATLSVSTSTFDHNRAAGGNDNRILLPASVVPLADGPNNAYGGAILVFQGSAWIQESTLDHNQAIGGAGGATQNGSLGAGGGIFFFSFLGGVTATVSNSHIAHNDAMGGAGNTGRGGDGLGGGIAIGSLGATFSAASSVTVSATLLEHNRASGGIGGQGGNGQGGGLFNGAGATLTVLSSTITDNQARAGNGTGGPTAGQGRGGGVYNLGTFAFDLLTLIANNHATTSNDNVFP